MLSYGGTYTCARTYIIYTNMCVSACLLMRCLMTNHAGVFTSQRYSEGRMRGLTKQTVHASASLDHSKTPNHDAQSINVDSCGVGWWPSRKTIRHDPASKTAGPRQHRLASLKSHGQNRDSHSIQSFFRATSELDLDMHEIQTKKLYPPQLPINS